MESVCLCVAVDGCVLKWIIQRFSYLIDSVPLRFEVDYPADSSVVIVKFTADLSWQRSFN